MRTSCAVVGAGPADIASTWRDQRCDSFRLNTSDWMNDMPAAVQRGSVPSRDEVVERLHQRAEGLPVRAGTAVDRVRREGDGLVIAR